MERSRGWIIKQALLAWVQEEEERHRMTLEALADVDAGKIIDHQSIHAHRPIVSVRQSRCARPAMKRVWAQHAGNDLVRLHEILAPMSPPAAAKVIQHLVGATGRLPRFPRMGERLDLYDPCEVRRVFAGDYEIRYQVTPKAISILRLWQDRERR
jgi:plasmid stabilization system protein ParE/predicted transcriptional regulator